MSQIYVGQKVGWMDGRADKHDQLFRTLFFGRAGGPKITCSYINEFT